jgi:predicted DNA-binding protein with PD1-like motif
MRVHALRLIPGDDLKRAIVEYCKDHSLSSAWIITCVGSLRRAKIRLANHTSLMGSSTNSVVDLEQKFEICSLVGTVSANGRSCHLHASLADKNGDCVGGHLMDGCEVFTTAEIILGSSSQMRFEREHDEATGFDELVVRDADDEAARRGEETTTIDPSLKGKRARRARQMAAIEEDRARREEAGELPVETRGILGFFVNLVAPPPKSRRRAEEQEEMT